MTRKQAILEAISLLEAKKGQEAAIQKLKEISAEMPFVKWTEDTVKDAVEQFMAEFGKLPSATDIKLVRGMPSHPTFAYLFGTTYKEWREKNFPSFYKPESTRRAALELAANLLKEHGEAAEKIKDLLDEYPWTKWNAKNIQDGIEMFVDEHDRLPTNEDFTRVEYLPYNEIFQYYFHRTRNQWLTEYCPHLISSEVKTERERRKHQKDFIAEYLRLKPVTAYEYNKKKQKGLPFVRVLIAENNVSNWEGLINRFNLPKFQREKKKMILSLELIVI